MRRLITLSYPLIHNNRVEALGISPAQKTCFPSLLHLPSNTSFKEFSTHYTKISVFSLKYHMNPTLNIRPFSPLSITDLIQYFHVHLHFIRTTNLLTLFKLQL